MSDVPSPESFTVGAEALAIADDGQPTLRGSLCRACSTRMVPPVSVCSNCASEDVMIENQPREGVLYSYTVLHVGDGRWPSPMAVGYVDLPNGVRVFSRLEGDGWSIGQDVTFDVSEFRAPKAGQPVRTFIFRPALRR